MELELVDLHYKYPKVIYDGCLFVYQKSCKKHLRWKCRRSFKDKQHPCPCVLKTNCDLNDLKIIAVDHHHTHFDDQIDIATIKQRSIINKQIASQPTIDKNTTYSNIRKKFPINKNGKRIRDPVKGNNNDYKRPISSIEDQHIDNYIRDRDFQNNNLEQVINRNKYGKNNHVDYNSNEINPSEKDKANDNDELKKISNPVTGLQVLKSHVIRHICNQIIHHSDLGESRNALAVFVKRENQWKMEFDRLFRNLKTLKESILRSQGQKFIPITHGSCQDVCLQVDTLNKARNVISNELKTNNRTKLETTHKNTTPGTNIKILQHKLNFNPIQPEVAIEITHPKNTHTKMIEHKKDFNSRLSKIYIKNSRLKSFGLILSDVESGLMETHSDKSIEETQSNTSSGQEITQLKTVVERIQHKATKLQSNIMKIPSKINIRFNKNKNATKIKQHEVGYKKTQSKITNYSKPLDDNNSCVSILTNLKDNIQIDFTKSDNNTSTNLETNINQYETSIEKKKTETATNVTNSKNIYSNMTCMPIFTDLNKNVISNNMTISKLNKSLVSNDTNSSNNLMKTTNTQDNFNELFKNNNQIEENALPELNDKSRPNPKKNSLNHLSSTMEKHKFKSFNSFDQIRPTLQVLTDVASKSKEDLINSVVKLMPVPIGIPIFSQKDSRPFDDENLFDEQLILEVKFDLSGDKNNKLFPTGVVVKWDFKSKTQIKNIKSYELYSTSDLSSSKPTWSKISELQPLPLPMSCTLKLAELKRKTYFFIVRAKYLDGKFGSFSIPLGTPSI